MINTFLKPEHEYLDETGYFAPVPHGVEHLKPEELSSHRSAGKTAILAALCTAMAAVMSAVFYSMLMDLVR